VIPHKVGSGGQSDNTQLSMTLQKLSNGPKQPPDDFWDVGDANAQ